MFLVFLTFSGNKMDAGKYMDGHNDWIRQGFDEGVFLMTGSLEGGAGGAVIAHNTTGAELGERVNRARLSSIEW